MLPSEHFIVAFLPVFAYVAVRAQELPSPRLVGVVFVGSQFPDLIDKPLAHELYLLPSGRVFMHSLPFAIPVVVIVILYGWKTGRIRAGGIFAFAYLSHIVADNHTALVRPDPHLPPDLLWPFLPPISRPIVPHWAGTNLINLHLWSAFSLLMLSIVVCVLVADAREQFALFKT